MEPLKDPMSAMCKAWTDVILFLFLITVAFIMLRVFTEVLAVDIVIVGEFLLPLCGKIDRDHNNHI